MAKTAASPDIALALRRFKAEFFQALAHPVRVHVVELLRDAELSAGSILNQLEIEQANGSQHLAVLRAKSIVLTRKEGNQVFYRLRDPIIVDVLDILRKYFHSQISENLALLEQMNTQERT